MTLFDTILNIYFFIKRNRNSPTHKRVRIAGVPRAHRVTVYTRC